MERKRIEDVVTTKQCRVLQCYPAREFREGKTQIFYKGGLGSKKESLASRKMNEGTLPNSRKFLQKAKRNKGEQEEMNEKSRGLGRETRSHRCLGGAARSRLDTGEETAVVHLVQKGLTPVTAPVCAEKGEKEGPGFTGRGGTVTTEF